jgi:hypothetical protein
MTTATRLLCLTITLAASLAPLVGLVAVICLI